jgi:Na+/H+-dicarboxylate symporter
MKIWLKYLIATIVGVAAGLVIPTGDGAVLDSIALIAMNLSRYALIPLVFFSTAVAAFELHEEKRLFRVLSWTVAYSLASIVALALVGLAGAFIIAPGRIPLSTDTASKVESLPKLFEVLGLVFPGNVMATLFSSEYLVPAAVLAIILGVAFAFDKVATKPAVTFFDSLSRIGWQINSFIVELLPLPLIAVSMAQAASMARTQRLGIYKQLFMTIGIETLVVLAILLPLALFALDRKKNPYKTLFGLTAPALAALVSGHAYIPAGVAAKHLKESLGVRRRAGAVSLPFALAFGKAGSAMVTATAFIAILNSYSNLGLGSSTVLWILGAVPLTALALGASPGTGPIVALAALCVSYGRGFESGYMVLLPAALPLALIAAFVDIVVSSCIVSVVASRNGYQQTKDARHFI